MHLTSQEEEQLIHQLLGEQTFSATSKSDPAPLFAKYQVTEHLSPILLRMAEEKLLVTSPSTYGRSPFFVQLTPLGLEVSQRAGGYHAYRAALTEQQTSRKPDLAALEHVVAQAATATTSTATIAQWALGVSLASLLTALLALYLAVR